MNIRKQQVIKDKLTEVLKERIRISEETQDNWDYGIEQCNKKEIELLSQDIKDTIDFFEKDCTEAEFSWLSEVFEDVAQRTHSMEFVETLRRIAAKYPEETELYNIEEFIDSAEVIVEKSH